MKEFYSSDLRAHIQADAKAKVRAIRHSDEYWESPNRTGGALDTAIAYLRSFADTYEVPTRRLDNARTKVSYVDPVEQGEEYRLGEEKHHFDAGVFGFYQTVHNLPVWRKGMKVTVKQGPNRVVASVDTSLRDVDVTLPSTRVLNAARKALLSANQRSLGQRAIKANQDLSLRAVEAKEAEAESAPDEAKFLTKFLKPSDDGEAAAVSRSRIIRGRFWIYRYDAKRRLSMDAHQHPDQDTHVLEDPQGGGEVHGHMHLPFKLPAVPDSIQHGKDYVVAEVTLALMHGSHKHIWRVLVELETNAILYVEPFFAGVDGLVFENDPITKTGDTSLDSTSDSMTLNPHRDDVVLQNLDAPSGGNQNLSGTWAFVGQEEGANIAPPVESSGTDFDYDVRTNNFASTSGYFHVDRIFRTIEDLGFNVTTYMANTNFPVPVDIRCFNNVNAHCVGDGMGGIDHVGYGLMDTTDTANPLGRACDPRVHLHEVLGHGILYEAVDSANMNFTHSAGDSLSLIYFDPDSQCWGVDGTPVNKPGDLRFTYVPWHPSLDRRADRDVAAGWAWGGSRDNSGYGSEEILLTTLFNFYRSIGGDHPNLGRRQFASRMAMYLIIRAIGDLTPATDPDYARDFAAQMMTTDQLNWTSEGVFGGAYSKVVRWVFEQQGEYQTPLITNATSGSVTTAGDPPEFDVYIDDGRAGGYEFQRVHWACPNVWNRRDPDGIHSHQEAALGETNYMYCKVKNRGTSQAQNVVVRGFHTKPGAGLNWPADFDPLTTAQLPVGTLDPNDSEEVLVGPFEWTPNVNTHGHDCVLMVVSSDGDPANIDNFTAGETIPEWRLVPNDNNVAQRNVNLVPGGGGEDGLMAGLSGISFFVGNPNPARGRFTFDITLPRILRKLGWRLEIEGLREGVVLKSGERREVFLKLHPGNNFTADEIEAIKDRDIRIEVLHDDNSVGGMTYRLDPSIKRPFNDLKDKRPGSRAGGKPDDCTDQAQKLADCLGIKQDIDGVCVKEIVLGLKVKGSDCC
ncbi:MULTISPECIES: hypothetical protein [unclassified Ruegeria]|uniref:hypothetical protein n=1 Tax=unclassified Ruegeria TaxID=2625375 RepID=UPI0014932276|nr:MULTISPECIES: hypothetical protein [unclassified Ruegeria]NOD88222.1 hypothetical protein [Ruegeria sp. HKCCD4318]NOE13131.1 hypothetical protein [Ruegeria sp. HKCCD4318-2]NOG11327.1 hypothetical protein [Ruegeria sp. HKCCD4315]